MDHPIEPVRNYLFIYLALLVLLAATVGVAYLDLAPWASTALAMLIATTKAVLVILFFMHVRHSSPVTRMFVLAGFAWLLILIGLTFTDYLSRTGVFFIR